MSKKGKRSRENVFSHPLLWCFRNVLSDFFFSYFWTCSGKHIVIIKIINKYRDSIFWTSFISNYQHYIQYYYPTMEIDKSVFWNMGSANYYGAEGHSVLRRTSKMEPFVKIVNDLQSWIIFAKYSILDCLTGFCCWRLSECLVLTLQSMPNSLKSLLTDFLETNDETVQM